MSNFSKNIKLLRECQSLTQAELANRLEVSSATVAHWERGKNYPNERTVSRLCSIFKVSRADLFDELFSMPSKKEHVEGFDTFSFSPTVHKVIDECLDLGVYGDDREGFIVDCIYRRWTELKQEEREQMHRSSDPLENDEWGGVKEAKGEVKKDRALSERKKELPVDEKN